MLDRLEGVFTTQQSFFDDAGHELRTLITILRGHLAAHGGAVELADRPGGGSMFTIVIPVRPTSA
jgi:signal transduction histidine kinase